MKVKGRFDHFNIDVTNLEQSIRFYETGIGSAFAGGAFMSGRHDACAGPVCGKE